MKQRVKLKDKLIASLLALAMLFAAIPVLSLPSAAPESVGKVVDPSTMDGWKSYFGSQVLNTEYAGVVWTDKSVFADAEAFNGLVQMKDPANNFLVALSAIASNKSIVGYSHIPTDTMLVLDVSGSMNDNNNNAVAELVQAANAAITQLQAVNRYNRVGVVLYSGSSSTNGQNASTVLLPLDRYTHATGNYLIRVVEGNRNTDEYVTVNSGVIGAESGSVRGSKQVVGATFIQSGVYTAMEELLAVTDTTIEGDGFQSGTTRMPIMVLMSDGAPTLATNRFAGSSYYGGTPTISSSNMGDGNTASATNALGFVTQLTASYAKAKIEEHYNTDALFYTLGFSVGNQSIARSVLDPKNSTSTINSNWEAYLKLKGNEQLVVRWNYTSYSVGYNAYATEQHYVDQYFSADAAGELTDVFDAIVQQIILQSLYYPTLVDSSHNTSGYVRFEDDLGEYMEVKDVQGILLGDTLFTGALLAANFTGNGGLLGTVESPTELGDELVRAVIKRLGIDQNPAYPTHPDRVNAARELINMAYLHGQLAYTSDTEFSNYIGWYADAAGNYVAFWDESHTAADVPAGAAYTVKSYGMLGAVKDGYRESDMMYVSIQVRTEMASGNSQMIWQVPAALVPVVTYNISLDGDSLESATNISVEIEEASPIRLLFEVGLRSDITGLNITEKVEDSYRNADGTYSFYSNRWSMEEYQNEDLQPSDMVNASVVFDPSFENERYYYNENTTIYQLVGGEYRPYSGSAKPAGDNFYRQVNSFHITDAATGAAELKTEWEAVSPQAQSVAKRFDDGTWYVPMGTIRRTTDGRDLSKSENRTDTLPAYLDLRVEYQPDADLSDGDDSYYGVGILLGNNGKLTVTPSTGLVISKTVDETVSDANALFSFTVKSDAVGSGTFLATYVDGAGNERSTLVTFTDGVSAPLVFKAGEQVYLTNLPEGDYTVTEDVSGDYRVKSINGSAVTGEDSVTVAVTQYALTPVAFENTVKTHGNVIISKRVIHPLGEGYQIPTNLFFRFEVTVTDIKGNPRANTVYQTATGASVVTNEKGIATLQLNAGQTVRIVGIEETDRVTVREVDLPAGFSAAATELSAVVSAEQNAVLEFVNTYTPGQVEPVNVTVEGTKVLIGRQWLDSDSFRFELQRYDRPTATWEAIGKAASVNAADPTFSFTDLLAKEVYDAVGTYHYRVVETYDAESIIGGVAYDTNPRYFNVLVRDGDMNGQLEIYQVEGISLASISYEDATDTWHIDTTFTNTYAPAGSAGITITLQKTVESLSGQPYSPEGFRFGLFQGDVLLGDPVTTGADGSAQLRLVYNASDCGNTYTYLLKEIAGEIPGMQYTDTVYVIEVTVVDNLDGTVGVLVYDATADDSIPAGATDRYHAGFTNIYDPSDATVTVEGNKVLTGRDLLAGEFSFDLYKTDSTFAIAGLTPIATAANKSNGAFSFDALTFDQVGTYYYAVAEAAGSLGGVRYDSSIYRITVQVSDNGGLLTARVITVNGEGTTAPIVFENTYDAADTAVTLAGTKTVTGRDLLAGEFTFGLYQTDSSFSITGKTAIQTAVNNAKGAFAFAEIGYSAPGIYYYTVVEEKGDLGGVTYDATAYHITVTVTDNGKGQLVATTAMTDGAGHAVEAIRFVNGYTAAGTAIELAGNKTVTGRPLVYREFAFNLYQTAAGFSIAGLTPVESVQNHADGAFAFSALTFDRAGVYYFAVTEEQGALGGVTYDTTVYRITVTVTDNGKGQLIAATAITDGTGKGVDAIAFANTYVAAPTSVTLSGNKNLIGRPQEDGEFAFELYQTASDFISGKTPLQVADSTAAGKFTFGALTFEKAGVYYYTVLEQQGSLGGVRYDSALYRITVTVTDNGHGQLEASVAIANEAGVAVSGISFTNVYTAADTAVTVSGQKVLTGRPLKAGEFSFLLYSTAADFAGEKLLLQTAGNTAGGHFTFAPLAFTEIGTYYYVVEEQLGALGGVDYDRAIYRITVTVTDDGEGKLIATTRIADGTGNGKDAIVFTNGYSTTSAEVTLSGNKTLTGREMTAGEFGFELYQTDANFATAGSTLLQTVQNDAKGKFTFDTLRFAKAGTYYYVAAEKAGSLGGITYDRKVYHITVTVTDNGEGKLIATTQMTDALGSTVSAITFANRYTASPVSTGFAGSKLLTGKDIAAGEFTFVLYRTAADFTGSKALVEKAVNGENGEIAFSVLSFDKAGVYYFQIAEEKGDLPGVSYDEGYYNITVTVIDNGSGALEIQSITILDESGKSASAITFTNTYVAAPTSVTLQGTKLLTGRDLLAGEFDFELFQTGADFNLAGLQPMATATNGKDGAFAFSALTYDKAGSYYYLIREAAGDLGGVLYDSATFRVTVTVTDDGNGQLKAAVTTVNAVGTSVAAIRFNNRYVTDSASAVITGTKALTGRVLYTGEFAFQLYASNNDFTVSGDPIRIARNQADGSFAFPAITYTAPGTYYYVMTEEAGVLGGIAYDGATYRVTVTVTDNGKGQLIAVTAIANAEGEPVDRAIFTNTYTTSNVGVTFSGNKTLTGRDLLAGEFGFDLYQTDSTFAIAGLKALAAATNGADGKFSFAEQIFTEAGTYYFAVTEQKGDLGGVRYDSTLYCITVTVTDNQQGKLLSEVQITLADGSERDSIRFANGYTAAETAVSLTAGKTLTGREMAEGEFAFALYRTGMHFAITGTPIQTVQSNAKGEITFAPISYTAAGTYYYAVQEVKGNLGGVTYDSSIYYVTVTVTDDGNGQLVATTAIADDGGKAVDAITFANTYTAAETAVDLAGTKTLTGREMVEGEFAFSLYQTGADFAIDGLKALQTVQNAADGTFAFQTLPFDKAGVYYYAVAEEQGGLGGVTYDDTVYRITVTVTDNQKGALVAEVAIATAATAVEAMGFTNLYTADSASQIFTGNKVLTGRPLKEGEFSFALYQTGADFAISTDALQTVQNNAGGSFAFEAVHFERAGQYYFAIAEVKGDLGGVSYDGTLYCVTVTVTDDGQGQLVAKITSVNAGGNAVDTITFANSYQTKGTEIKLSGKKLLTGRDLAEGEFTFNLVAADESFAPAGDPIPAVNGADGSFGFAIPVTEAGIYRFVITEEAGALERMTYDTAEYRVTVTVTDNGVGALEVTDIAITKGDEAVETVVFVNTYTPKPTDITVDLQIDKTVDNRGSVQMTPEGFAFLVENTAGGDPVRLITDALGKASLTLTFTEEDIGKVYTYRISEEAGTVEGMTYSDQIYTVTVTVALDEATNTLVASLTVDGEAADEAVAEFVNIYDFKEVPETGDSLVVWMGMLAISCGAILTLSIRRRKKLHLSE